MRSITVRRALSTATTWSCLTDANTLPVAWLTATQWAVAPTSIFCTLSPAGSITSTALPSSPDDHTMPALVDHHAVRRVDVAEVDHARERLRGQVDHHDAAVRIDALGEDAVAVDRGVGGAAVERERDLVGRARHVDGRRHGERRGVEKMHLVGGLGGDDEVRAAGAIVGVDHADFTPRPAETARRRSTTRGDRPCSCT